MDQQQQQPQPQQYQQPQYQQPVQQELSGGAKFGYFALGLFLSWIGVLISWLVNKDKAPQVKSSAIKFSVIGMIIAIVGYIILFVLMFVVFASVGTSLYY